MATQVENERKFLVDETSFRLWMKDHPYRVDAVKEITQAYLSTGDPTVRVRRVKTKGEDAEYYLTIKGPGLQKRREFEMFLEEGIGKEMFRFAGACLVKTRYVVKCCERTWEVDVFKKEMAGLCMAELENQSLPDDSIYRPDWLGNEVTHDRRYANASLAGVIEQTQFTNRLHKKKRK